MADVNIRSVERSSASVNYTKRLFCKQQVGKGQVSVVAVNCRLRFSQKAIIQNKCFV